MKGQIVLGVFLASLAFSGQATATIESSDFNNVIEASTVEQRGLASQIETEVSAQAEITSDKPSRCLAGYSDDNCDRVQAELALHKKINVQN